MAAAEECGGADVAVVLGSGLGDFADHLGGAFTIPYGDIPHWPASRVMGHAGKLVAGTLAGKNVLALSGRVHVYEGHDMQTVTFAMRALGRLGDPARDSDQRRRRHQSQLRARRADGDRRSHQPAGQQSAGGAERRPVRPALSGHDLRLFAAAARDRRRDRAARSACRFSMASTSPCSARATKRPAEIRAFRTLGADAVGMSTVPEAIAARHMGIEVLGISCITNAAAGVFPEPLHHSEVMETAQQVKGQFIALLEGIIGRL